VHRVKLMHLFLIAQASESAENWLDEGGVRGILTGARLFFLTFWCGDRTIALDCANGHRVEKS